MAFLAGAGTFALVAVVVSGIESDVVVGFVGVAYVAAVVAVARGWGVVYAVPIAMAGYLAFDWFYLPPTHPLQFPDSANLVDLFLYLAVAVLVAELGAHAARRGEVSEVARSELATEQAALRRVATLVAEAVPARELLAAVAEEAGTLLDVDATRIVRYETEEEIVYVAGWSASGYDPPSFGRARLEGTSVSADVLRTGRIARIDNYEDVEVPAPFTRGLELKSVVGAPIVVEGRRWGVMVAWSTSEALPEDVGARLTDFTELVATAISNAEARAEVGRLADEQAALRRVATLVARGVPPPEVFAAVASELGRLLGVDATYIMRYAADGTGKIVAGWGEPDWGEPDSTLPVGSSVTLGGDNVGSLVSRTERPARVDDYNEATGPLADYARKLGVRSEVGSPIVVDGRLWGAMIATTRQAARLPADTEARIGQFTELVGMAILNVQTRSDLAASRARIVAATDETRRRFERDLHDGVQQRLVSLSLELRAAETMTGPGHEELGGQMARVVQELTGVLDDLRELSRGIHPAILTDGGLGPALKTLARRSAIPVKLDVRIGKRLEEHVEVAAYYVVSEALANTAKHARASIVEIEVEARNGILVLAIQDDGVGGADTARGSGLIGLTDRVEALGGTIAIVSPPGEGTSLHVELPVEFAAPSGYAPPRRHSTP
jgi:signal transduction histidine kinase